MNNDLIMTDGAKSISLTSKEGWTYFNQFPSSTQLEQYAKVAASFRAYNLIANTVSNMPFVLLDKKGEEYDTSAHWENKCGFLPNPKELLRLDTLSLISTNSAYNIRTKDVLGRKTKGLYHAVASAFIPFTNPLTGQLDYIERLIGSQIERYAPDDPRLVRLWRLDHTTEVLPSKNTEAQAVMSSAGQVYYADLWIEHFYKRGGIPPTLIAMKGLVFGDKKEDEEKSWTDWLKGLGRFTNRIARIFNAETMDVKQMGSTVADLKNNEVYRQALENIGIGHGIPISKLLANAANYATAQQDVASWFTDDIIPRCEWIAYEYNWQVWEPLGLRMEFRPETLDPEQEDETSRASAVSTFIDFFTKCPTYEIFIGTCSTFGYELSEDLVKAAEEYYAEKERNKEAAPTPPTSPTDDQPIQLQDVQSKAIKTSENSTMIALRIPDVIRAEIQEKYPFVDSETLNSLHITLIYLGDNRTLNKIDVIRAATEFSSYQAPIKGRLQGLARFVNGQDVDPLVVTFDSPQLPQVYSALASVLDSYHIPYHKEHGFIPHMTLAYIPKDSKMPIETIEPIEINFSEIYVVSGDEWLTVSLAGYENKRIKWIPSLDELQELKVWREVATRRHKKGDSLDFVYQPHYGGLPADIQTHIIETLPELQSREQIAELFQPEQYYMKWESPLFVTVPPAIELTSEPNDDILQLAAALNKYTETIAGQQQQT
jgi:2'-5' RNA ligase